MANCDRYCALLGRTIFGETMGLRAYRRLVRLAPTQLAKAAHIRMGSEAMVNRKVDQLLYARYCGWGPSPLRARKSRP